MLIYPLLKYKWLLGKSYENSFRNFWDKSFIEVKVLDENCSNIYLEKNSIINIVLKKFQMIFVKLITGASIHFRRSDYILNDSIIKRHYLLKSLFQKV